MLKDLKIGNRKIGINQKIFISAEVGTTCNGDVKTAKKLIDAAKAAGMDAVKFQILTPDEKYSDKTLKYSYTRFSGKRVEENMFKLVKKYVLPLSAWAEIKRYADKRGIIMFATTDHFQAVEIAEKIKLPAYKIATWDVTYRPLTEKIARLGKPTILDFGASDKAEVGEICNVFKRQGNRKLVLLHCYHTNNYKEMNLMSIKYLREKYGFLSGFSAADEKNEVDYLALAFRPVYIEKRLTLNKRDPEHHHSRALEPDEMKEYVKNIHNLSAAIGKMDLIPSANDLIERKKWFTGLVAGRNIKKGEKFSLDNIACKRPLFDRLDPKHIKLFIGKTAKRDIRENESMRYNMF